MSAYRFGPFRLDPDTRRLDRSGVPVDLPPRCFELLLTFVRSPAIVHRRQDLLDRLWSADTDVGDGALSQAILIVRKALEPEGRQYLRTVPRVGYAFDADVRIEETDAEQRPLPAPAAIDASADASRPEPPSAAPATSRPLEPRSRVRAPLAAAVACLLIAVAAWYGLHDPRPRVEWLRVDAPRPAEGEDAQPWVRGALASILDVALRGSPGFRFVADATSDPSLAAPRLSAEYRLVDAGGQVVQIHWRLELPGEVAQEWQQQVASDRLLDVLAGLRVQLDQRLRMADAMGAAPDSNAEALTAFTQGLREREAERLPQARAAFESAVAADPRLAVARYELARVLDALGYRNLAVSQARQALSDAQAQGTGFTSVVGATLHTLLGEHDRAAALYAALATAQPADVEWRIELASAQLRAGDPAAARAALDRLDPAALRARWRVRWMQASAAIEKTGGRLEEAERFLTLGLDEARERGLDDLAAELHYLSSEVAWLRRDSPGTRAALDAALAAYRELRDVEGQFKVAQARLALGRRIGIDVTDADLLSLLTMAQETGNPRFEAMARFAMASQAEATGRLAEAAESYAAARMLSGVAGEQGLVLRSGIRAGRVAVLIGELEPSDRDLRHAMSPDGPRLIEPTLLDEALIPVAHALGDIRRASDATRRLSAGHPGVDAAMRKRWHCVHAQLLIIMGRRRDAEDSLAQCRLVPADDGYSASRNYLAIRFVAEALLADARGSGPAAEAALRIARDHVQAASEESRRLLASGVAHAATQVLRPADAARWVDGMLADTQFRLLGRPLAEVHALRGALAVQLGDVDRARTALHAAQGLAPSREGRLGSLLTLLELALAEAPAEVTVRDLLGAIERGADFQLARLAERTLRQPTILPLATDVRLAVEKQAAAP